MTKEQTNSWEDNKKCICACHGTEFNSMKKHSPVIHDTQCCINMNGSIVKNNTNMDWESDLLNLDAVNKNMYFGEDSRHAILFEDAVKELKDFIEQVISQEKEKMIEEIKKGQRGLYHKIVEDHCDECRIITYIINLLQNK